MISHLRTVPERFFLGDYTERGTLPGGSPSPPLLPPPPQEVSCVKEGGRYCGHAHPKKKLKFWLKLVAPLGLGGGGSGELKIV